MKLFNRQKTVVNIPPELQQYYQYTPPRERRRWPLLLALLGIIIVALLVGFGVWQLTKPKAHTAPSKPAASSSQKVAPKRQPSTSQSKPATPTPQRNKTPATP